MILGLAAGGPLAADDSVGLTPLIDMSPADTYLGAQGGLYPQGQNAIPVPHLVAGMREAIAVRPRDAAGQPAANGRIVLLSIGMSNTSQESNAFNTVFQAFAGRNPLLRFVNGAQGGQTAAIISDPTANFWTVVDQRLAAAGLTPQQVQAIWYKEANAGPTDPFPQYPQVLRDQSAAIMQIIKTRFPNARLLYTSSRIYGGYATTPLNPEPYAYESGFAMKWLIEDQIEGDADLNYRPQLGPVVSPWIQWGPYTWADGLMPRSDGLTWLQADFQSDGTHPSSAGATKVANQLLAHLSTAPTARIWFLAPGQGALLGDMNGDQLVDFFDIEVFLLALFDPAGYAVQYPTLNAVERGDVTQNGIVDFFDIDGFLALLFAI